MAPQIQEKELFHYEDGTKKEEKLTHLVGPQAAPRIYEIVYRNVLLLAYWHIAGSYGIYLCFVSAKWQTMALAYLIFALGEIGVTAGAHRLWSHKAFKAKRPLQILLMIFNSMANQGAVVNWVRDHRLHHKYTDTDADPHNATRGFFYSHVGWFLVKRHSEVEKRGKTIDLSDIYSNPVLEFQRKNETLLAYTFSYALSTLIPVYCWNETLINAWHITIMRTIPHRHAVFLVNSAAHMFGTRPYDKSILPSQSILVSIATFGEGFHNYHHVFPWDYRAAELGNNVFNWTTWFIDFFAWIGWAYDLKTVSKEAIERRAKRTGDGSSL